MSLSGSEEGPFTYAELRDELEAQIASSGAVGVEVDPQGELVAVVSGAGLGDQPRPAPDLHLSRGAVGVRHADGVPSIQREFRLRVSADIARGGPDPDWDYQFSYDIEAPKQAVTHDVASLHLHYEAPLGGIDRACRKPAAHDRIPASNVRLSETPEAAPRPRRRLPG